MNRKTCIRYYQETDTGDYLCVDLYSVYKGNFNETIFEGRATGIIKDKRSMCTTGIAESYLERTICKRVFKKDVPKDWLYQMNGE